MTELERLRAEVEALKLMCSTLFAVLPAGTRAPAMLLAANTAATYAANLQYTPLTDEQIEHLEKVVLIGTAAGPSPAKP